MKTPIPSPSQAAAIKKVVKLLGGINATARAVGIKPPSVFGWLGRGQCPADRCLQLETLVHGQVTRYELRPDIYGKPPGKRGRPKRSE